MASEIPVPNIAVEMDQDDEHLTGPVKRKHKSLLTLCKRFLEMYPLELPAGCSSDIPIEQLSNKLNLSRRRLYDIINIMESLQMAVKVTKNLYRWYGTKNVQKLLTQLKHMSDQEMSLELEKLVCVTDLDDSPVPTQPPCTPLGNDCAQSLLLHSLIQAPLTPATTKLRQCNLVNMNESPEPKGPTSWKMKSLGGTCLKFLTLFFKHEAVSLDWAGRVLLCGPEDDKTTSQSSQDSSQSSQDSLEVEEDLDPKEHDRQLRNKVRRIYDVANVLCALGLVCKIKPQRHNSRKLLYAYCGPAIGDSLQPFPVKGVATIIQGPTKPKRPKPPLLQEKIEARAFSEGQCKRKLELGIDSDATSRKKTLVDEVLLELDESSSALSVLLAVAERELIGMTSQKSKTAKAIDELSVSVQSPKKELPKIPSFNPQTKPKNPSPNKISVTARPKIVTNQENNFSGTVGKLLLPKIPPRALTCSDNGRSALRSLLENNQNQPTVKSDFPAIRKFVICNEASTQQGQSVFITPASACFIRSPIQTVVIRNSEVVLRRGTLSIPSQLIESSNHNTSQVFTTHLTVDKLEPTATPEQQ